MSPSARVICDSVSPQGIRLTTMEVILHRFVLAELNTHRVFSRNYRSSRAVPVAKLLEEVRTNPAMPVYWGANRPGMSAGMELEGNDLTATREQWRLAARDAVTSAEVLSGIGLHKQIANRVLEPFLWCHGVVTATEWDNFFGLRLDRAAQPEMRALAEAMWVAREGSTPTPLKPEDWHLPYVNDLDITEARDRNGYIHPPTHRPIATFDTDAMISDCIKQSVARCARVSVKPFDADRPSTLAEDLALYDKLVGAQPIHASPAEHQAMPDSFEGAHIQQWDHKAQWGNLRGWRQYRKMLPGEAVAPLPEGYH